MMTPVLFDGRSPEKTIEFISDFLQTSQVFGWEKTLEKTHFDIFENQ